MILTKMRLLQGKNLYFGNFGVEKGVKLNKIIYI